MPSRRYPARVESAAPALEVGEFVFTAAAPLSRALPHRLQRKELGCFRMAAEPACLVLPSYFSAAPWASSTVLGRLLRPYVRHEERIPAVSVVLRVGVPSTHAEEH